MKKDIEDIVETSEEYQDMDLVEMNLEKCEHLAVRMVRLVRNLKSCGEHGSKNPISHDAGVKMCQYAKDFIDEVVDDFIEPEDEDVIIKMFVPNPPVE
jgi:hypothetical protein